MYMTELYRSAHVCLLKWQTASCLKRVALSLSDLSIRSRQQSGLYHTLITRLEPSAQADWHSHLHAAVFPFNPEDFSILFNFPCLSCQVLRWWITQKKKIFSLTHPCVIPNLHHFLLQTQKDMFKIQYGEWVMIFLEGIPFISLFYLVHQLSISALHIPGIIKNSHKHEKWHVHKTRWPRSLSLSFWHVCYFSLNVSCQNSCVLLSGGAILRES